MAIKSYFIFVHHFIQYRFMTSNFIVIFTTEDETRLIFVIQVLNLTLSLPYINLLITYVACC